MGTLSVSIRLNYQKVFLKRVRGEPLDCTMLRSQRGGRLDLRAEGSGGSRKGRGLNHIDSQERGGSCQIMEQHGVYTTWEPEMDPDSTALEEEPTDP